MTEIRITPHLVVRDGEGAISFYERAFGATVEAKIHAEDGRRLMHAHLRVGAGELYLMDDFPEVRGTSGVKAPDRLGGATSLLNLEVPDADQAWSRAVEAGAEVVMELQNQFWGARYGQLRDPFGHFWAIGGPAT